jgi:methionyl-tRNA formyltransferase
VRLVLVADSRSPTSVALTRAALARARVHREIEVVGLADVATTPPGRLARPRALLAEAGRHAFEPRAAPRGVRRSLPRGSAATLARRHRLPHVVPPGGRLNDPRFIARLETDLRPDATLALMVGELFGPALLSACRRPVNYHDGALPAFRGLFATPWSVYREEPRSGFSVHRMAAGVDDGPVLLGDAVPVAPRALSGQVQRDKTRLAGARMGDVLDRIARDEAGEAQQGQARSYTRAEGLAIRDVGDPAALAFAELQRRLRAFELVRLTLGGEAWSVTQIAEVEARRREPPLAFTTADGIRAAPVRFVHLPLALHRLHRALGRPGGARSQGSLR